MEQKYIAYGSDNFIKTFQDAYYLDKTSYLEKVAEFSKCLESSSQLTLQRFHDVVLKLPLPSKDFLIRKNSIYNQAELQQLAIENKFYKNISNYYNLYNLSGDEKLTISVFKYHCGLKYLPLETLRNLYNTMFIDCGAFFGDSALVFQRYKPSSIICFEPNSINFKRLQRTLLNNNIKANVVNKGLSNIQEEKELYYLSKHQNHGASYIFQAHNCKSELTQLTTLDTFLLQNFRIQKVGLIKLDTEGYGVQAIKGALNTINKYKPVISCAIYHNPEEMFTIYKLLQSCHSNYKFKVLALSQDELLKDLTLLAY